MRSVARAGPGLRGFPSPPAAFGASESLGRLPRLRSVWPPSESEMLWSESELQVIRDDAHWHDSELDSDRSFRVTRTLRLRLVTRNRNLPVRTRRDCNAIAVIGNLVLGCFEF